MAAGSGFGRFTCANLGAPVPRPGYTKPVRRARKGDPEFGPVCRCGRPKAKQALNCQPCSERRRGFGTVPLREQRINWWRRYMGIAPAVGNEDHGLIFLAAELEQARAQASGDLRLIVDEQAADDVRRQVGSRWLVSLDATDRYGRPLYELVAA